MIKVQNSPKKYFIFIIFLVGFVTYLNSLKNPFCWDDKAFYKENYFIRNIKNIPKIFVHDWYRYSIEMRPRPIPLISCFTYYLLAKNSVAGVRFLNIFLHCLCAVLLFIFAYKLFSNKQVALFSAIIFVVHPLNSEAVNIVTFNDDILVSIFILLGMLIHTSTHLKEKYKFYLEIIILIFALFSKELAIMLPVLLLLYDLLILNRKTYLRYVVHLAIVFMFVLFRFKFWIHPMESIKPPWSKDLFIYASILLETIVLYTKLVFYPFGLSLLNYLKGRLTFITLISGVMIVFILARNLTIYKRKDRRISFIFLLIILTVLPSLYPIFETKFASMRFMYLPMVGVSMLFPIFLMKFSRKYTNMFSILLIIYFSIVTVLRNRDFKDPVLLWKKEIGITQNHWIPWTVLGISYTEIKDYRESMVCFNNALKIKQDAFGLLLEIARTYNDAGHYNEAENILIEIINSISIHYEPYFLLGEVYQNQNKYDLSEEMYKKSISLFRTNGKAYLHLGRIYEAGNKIESAIDAYKNLLNLDPRDEEIRQKIKELSHKKSL